DLIERNAIPMIIRSEINTFIRWAQKLPQDYLYQKPSLGILFAWGLLVRGEQMQVANSLLQKIVPENEHTTGQLNTVRAMRAVYEGQILKAIELARQALDQLPPEDLFFRNIAGWNLSGALAVSGDIEGGFEVLREVVQTSLASHNYLVAIIGLCRLALAQVHMGKLNKAKEIFERAVDISTTDQKRPLPAASEALMGLGRVYWEWNQLEAAREVLQESITLSKRWREIAALDSYVALAHVLLSQGDVDGANQRMADALKLAVDNLATQTDDKYVACQQAHLRVRQGDLRDARRWAIERGLDKYTQAENLDLSGRTGDDIILHYELIVFSRILIEEKQIGQALSVLNLIQPSLKQWGYLKQIIEIYIIRAVGLHAQGYIDSAISAFQTAIDLAKPEGFTRVFLDEGQRVVPLLQELVSRGDKSKFTNGLLKSLTKSKTQITLVEPLSEREIEILRMLTTELSAPEIAERLHIAVTTVRTHTKNIYSKLGVHSRFEAVTKGEELNLM
ncbi:MAG: LuxR C-terminal-related transcriptional regulator, partial [Anaerolineales bacterium]